MYTDRPAGYDDLKALAAEMGQPIPTLLALARNNDPFFAGSPAQVEKAHWFAGLWREFGFSTGVHLRRVHYRLVSQRDPRMHDGTRYEIALNPDTFEGRSDAEIVSTLAHEMAHLWQQVHGKPSRGGYHNAQWAGKMKAIGLVPFNTDQPDKETGQRCSHTIKPGGVFEHVMGALLANGFTLTWEGYKPPVASAASANRNKTPYTCPNCGAKIWGKPGLNIVCGDDDGVYVPADVEELL